MAFQGGNVEKREIGLSIGISGTHNKTQINKTTGFLELVEIDKDREGRPIYVDKGSWTSDVIDLGDIFQDFEKVFTTSNIDGSSSFTILTRVSNNGHDWSEWTPIAMDGTIQSDTKQYIQIRIDLFAGFVTDTFIIPKSDFEANKYIEETILTEGRYIVPQLTSNTSSAEGFAFSSSQYSYSYAAWCAFNKVDRSEGFCTQNGMMKGYLGFCFTSNVKIIKYKIRSMASQNYLSTMPKNWIFQGSNDTTDGSDGTWIDLDIQTNQIWTTVNTDYVYEFENKNKYKAYRINFSENGGNTSYTGVGQLDFFINTEMEWRLKRTYASDMTLDSTWEDQGSVYRHKVTREEWTRIDRLEVFVQ